MWLEQALSEENALGASAFSEKMSLEEVLANKCA
jgi:hypothetical protein